MLKLILYFMLKLIFYQNFKATWTLDETIFFILSISVEHWAHYYSNCDAESQSPVNIVTNNSPYDKTIGNFTFNNYEQALPMVLKNNGHTGQLSMLSFSSKQHMMFTICCELKLFLSFVFSHIIKSQLTNVSTVIRCLCNATDIS